MNTNTFKCFCIKVFFGSTYEFSYILRKFPVSLKQNAVCCMPT